jgi:hypothetical protein
VTGILAFYPSKVLFHRHGKFLNNRDFFGECTAAAKKHSMRVVASRSPDLNWSDALDMDDYMPAIIQEVNSLYDVDCFYTGWPPLGSLPECHCNSAVSFHTPAYWRVFNDRLFDLWQRYDALAKVKKLDSFLFANLGGNVHAGPNLDRLAKIAAWFQSDNQGRTYDDPAIWGGTLQGRVANTVQDGSFAAANVTAAYSTGVVRWRNASKSPYEAKMWLNETLASGMIPYYHFIGSEAGFGEDRRWQKVGTDYFRWTVEGESAAEKSLVETVRSLSYVFARV